MVQIAAKAEALACSSRFELTRRMILLMNRVRAGGGSTLETARDAIGRIIEDLRAQGFTEEELAPLQRYRFSLF